MAASPLQNSAFPVAETPDTIWVIDDEPEIGRDIEAHLRAEGFEPRVFTDAVRVAELVTSETPDLFVMDVLMPGLSGPELVRKLKADPRTSTIPVIFLTGQGDEADVLAGLELGADDYLTKPFSLRLLVARIRAVLRRYRQSDTDSNKSVYQEGPIRMNTEGHEVTVDGAPVALTGAEYHLLEALLHDPGRVLTRKALLTAISKEDKSLIERNVDVHIGTLRRKLGASGSYILTVRGIGYKLRG